MSLLLDALKRAEQMKQSNGLSLAQLSSESLRAPARPATAGVAPGPALGSPAHRAEQAAARMAFMAKPAPVQNRPLWLLLGGLSLLSIAAGGFWLWYLLAYPPNPLPLAQSGALIRPAVALPVAVKPPVTTEPAATQTAAANLPQAEPAKSTTVFDPPSRRTQTPRQEILAAPAPQLKRSLAETLPAAAELNVAYTALVRGDYALAKQQYQLVLRGDPFNLDAYLGLATAAASTGDANAAQAYYRKALEIDPKNSVASAGLIALQPEENTAASERQLRAQIATLPAAAAPYSALGHVYSTQSRWGDAQQVFFEAYRLDPGNPDHAFNLAVSLDHLGQGALAREYYGKALKLAAARPAGFNTAAASERFNQLESPTGRNRMLAP